MELYRKYRPSSLTEVVGQATAVKTLAGYFKKNKLPQALLFSGPSGTGKTTLARIIAKMLKAEPPYDFFEINGADDRGIDTIRELKRKAEYSPMKATRQVIYLDEGHQLTPAAQTALLKITEDIPKQVQFIIATTHPDKLIATLRSRFTAIPLKPLSHKDTLELIQRVTQSEKMVLTGTVADLLAEKADGSGRVALTLLESLQQLSSEKEQTEFLNGMTDVESIKAIEIARGLFKGIGWNQMKVLLKDLSDDVETVRMVVLGYMNSILLNSANERAAAIMEQFLFPFYDSKKPGLTLACFKICSGR